MVRSTPTITSPPFARTSSTPCVLAANPQSTIHYRRPLSRPDTTILSLLAIVAAFLPIVQATPPTYVEMMRAKTAGKPNLIVIVADDLGYGDLGCYGQQRIRTPHLDRLAGEGIRFTQAYAGSPIGPPSRASLLTGLHTGHSRIRGRGDRPFHPADLTLAEFLQSAGYKTCAVGKWDLGRENTPGHPNLNGFEEWLGHLGAQSADDYYPPFVWRNQRRHDLTENVGGRLGKYSPDFFADAVANFIKAQAQLPLFIYFAPTLPRANVALGKLTGNGMQIPNTAPYSDEAWPEPERAKAAMITRLDADVGRLLALLDELNLADETVVLFTSDNGPHAEGGVDPAFFRSSGGLRGGKGDLYEGGIRVPLIVRWKGRFPAGKVSDHPVAFWDVLPTLADLAQVTAPKEIDGSSFLPTLQGQPPTQQHPFLYWESYENGFHQAIRQKNWKAIRPGLSLPLELYNLSSDPTETHNLATRHPEISQQLQSLLKEARTESPDHPMPHP